MSDRQRKDGDATGEQARQSTKRFGATGADGKPLGFSTLAVHGGEPRPKLGNALATPIVQTATYTFADTNTDATAIQPSASPNKNWPRWKARKPACFSPAAWRRLRRRYMRSCRITPMWS
ncbi:MAG: Aminotransferase class I/II-fold pyridoxal phosphate-dependent enzyme [Deltaproteobacteria bacterium]|nr:Aminotransferase class I/II-fold pyridoxal phosphate-dependent enzyme [Deltaproteobacteria bacterium]